MPCFKPIKITVPKKSQSQQVPCGRCIGCKLERSRQWAARITNEAQLYDCNSMLLLTYEDKYLVKTEKNYSTLYKPDLQLFFRYLRRYFPREKIRYFAAGEYGETCENCGLSKKMCVCPRFAKSLGRPHYHAIVLGFRPPDLVPTGKTDLGSPTWESAYLNRIWGRGMVSVSNVNFESAAYVARYCTKKITGKLADVWYAGREPEFAIMSRRPGIGKPFFDLYQNDIYRNGDSLSVRGKHCKPPRYYDKLLETANVARYGAIKTEREVMAILDEKTSVQRSNQMKNLLSKIQQQKRS